MPHSLILNLQPRSPIQPGYLSGKHLHALFLTLVTSIDAELGNHLHQQTTEKAFTLSPLQVAHSANRSRVTSPPLQWQHQHPIPVATPCWWRITLLDDALFGHLMPLWLNLNPQQAWHLGPTDLTITSVLGTPQSTQPWANFLSYAQLYEQASDSERRIDLEFCTPTTFRQGAFDSALPTRELIFSSLLKRWNRYSDRPFTDLSWESVFPSRFDLRTEIVSDARSKLIGCVGTLSLQILGDADPETIKRLNTLADFAFFSGIGRKTPMGMGMVRRRIRSLQLAEVRHG
jgi:CRISPR-associated endoribonuclease Cas6